MFRKYPTTVIAPPYLELFIRETDRYPIFFSDVELLCGALGLPSSKKEAKPKKTSLSHPSSEAVLVPAGSMVSPIDFQCPCGLTGYAATAGGAMAVQSTPPEAIQWQPEIQTNGAFCHLPLCVVSPSPDDGVADSDQLPRSTGSLKENYLQDGEWYVPTDYIA